MKLIRLTKVMDYTGLARSTIYKYIAEGAFPKPIPLGDRCVGVLPLQGCDAELKCALGFQQVGK